MAVSMVTSVRRVISPEEASEKKKPKDGRKLEVSLSKQEKSTKSES